eukprot:XP_001692211.1 predicted protein [Chlamydomonas reinhardtii]
MFPAPERLVALALVRGDFLALLARAFACTCVSDGEGQWTGAAGGRAPPGSRSKANCSTSGGSGNAGSAPDGGSGGSGDSSSGGGSAPAALAAPCTALLHLLRDLAWLVKHNAIPELRAEVMAAVAASGALEQAAAALLRLTARLNAGAPASSTAADGGGTGCAGSEDGSSVSFADVFADMCASWHRFAISEDMLPGVEGRRAQLEKVAQVVCGPAVQLLLLACADPHGTAAAATAVTGSSSTARHPAAGPLTEQQLQPLQQPSTAPVLPQPVKPRDNGSRETHICSLPCVMFDTFLGKPHPRYLSPYSSSAVHVFDLIAAAASSSLGVGGARAGRDAAASGGSGAAAAGSMSGGAGADDKARAWHCAPDRLCLALQLMLRLLPELQLRQAAARLPGLWRLLVAVLLHAAATRSTLFVEHESLDVLSDAGVLLRLRVCAATDGAPPLAAADEPNQGRQDHHGEQGQQQEEHPKQQLQGQQGPGQGPGQGQAEQDVALDEANAPDEASVGDSNGGHNVGGCTSSLPGTSRSCSVSLNSSDYDEDLQTMQAQTDQPRQQQPAAAAAAADCSYSLRCALDAGLLPALEQLVRSAVGGWSTAAGATGTRLAAVAAAAGPAAATGPGGSPQLQPQLQPQGLHQRLAMGRVTMATHAVGSLLLTSGVFPAVLAHGCPMQVVPLLSTMAGVLRCLTAGDGRGGGTGGIGGSGTGGGSLGGLQLRTSGSC